MHAVQSRRRRACWFALALTLPSLACAGGDIYLCETESGRAPVYQSEPCANGRPVQLVPEPPRGGNAAPTYPSPEFTQLLHDTERRMEANRAAQANAAKQLARTMRRDAAEAERLAKRCDRLLERMETVDRQARHRSTQALRERKNRLQEEHHRLGCSWFPSSR